jgi:hypothetical protein
MGGFSPHPRGDANEQAYTVRSVDVAAWMSRSFGPGDVIVMKIDVEGAEHRFLPKILE